MVLVCKEPMTLGSILDLTLALTCPHGPSLQLIIIVSPYSSVDLSPHPSRPALLTELNPTFCNVLSCHLLLSLSNIA